MKTLGLYLHIPFCKKKCSYCDFCSFPGQNEEVVDAYVERLCRDLKGKSGLAADYTVDSVYIGGGTPTLLSPKQVEKIGDALHTHYFLAKDLEFTIECNPATGSKELFSRLFEIGVNRVSVGLQSLHERELAALGRIHGAKEFYQTLHELEAAGFSNIGADLMFGIPHQSVKSYLATLETVASLSLTHLSCYGLILEEGTPFWKMQKDLPLPDEDAERKMYLLGADLLEKYGFFQYEISNFAKRGYESRHNLKYWNQDPFLGFGLAAYSDFGGERFGNSRDLAAYLRGEEIAIERERPTEDERANEYVMLAMRKAQGVSIQCLQEKFGQEFASRIASELKKYSAGGFVKATENGYAFTKNGFLVSNSILSDLLEFGSTT